MSMIASPQTAHDMRRCARRLLMNPLLCAERDPDTFLLVRRHSAGLDSWFTQRLGYRLHVGADTARLVKSGYVPSDRPLRTRSGRAFNNLEYIMLSLTLACTVAGPPVISLSELAGDVRSAAVEADVALPGEGTERRALVNVLRWMIDHGLADELFENIDTYASDAEADAVLRVRPDRITSLPTPALDSGGDIVSEAERREPMRSYMRARLVEDPVVYRDDLDEAEWMELRRRISEEARFLDEMFGLVIEARAEGIAAVDVDGSLSDVRFPTTGTLGHAALCLIQALAGRIGDAVTLTEVDRITASLIDSHARWDKQMRSSPTGLAHRIAELLTHVRLAFVDTERATLTLLPAAARFAVVESESEDNGQDALW